MSSSICHLCTDSGSYSTSPSECEKCPNRHRLNSGQCILKGTCLTGEFLLSDDLTCVSCEEIIFPNTRRQASSTECAKCGDKRMYVNGYCDAVCPFGYFRNQNRNCTACYLNVGKETSATECSACDNTGWPRTMSGNKCVSNAKCKVGNFEGADGKCYSCGQAGAIETDEEKCLKCDVSDYSRKYINGKCVRECDGTQFMTVSGECVDCSETVIYPLKTRESTAFECAKCGNQREYVDGVCAPNCDLINDGNVYFRNNSVSNKIKNMNCTICSEQNGKVTTSDQCAKCANSGYPRKMSGSSCVKDGW